jgi:hypothetical protein
MAGRARAQGPAHPAEPAPGPAPGPAAEPHSDHRMPVRGPVRAGRCLLARDGRDALNLAGGMHVRARAGLPVVAPGGRPGRVVHYVTLLGSTQVRRHHLVMNAARFTANASTAAAPPIQAGTLAAVRPARYAR